MKTILTVKNLTKTYPPKRPLKKSFTAVDGISFSLGKGEILGVLGPNGAGKSTTISMLMDVLTPTAGSIEVFGHNIQKNRSEIMKQVTFASTYVSMPWRLTILENLRVASLLYGVRKKDFLKRAEELLQFFDVWDQKDKTMGALSAGQITRVMLAKAFIPRPKIALLDEPTASLDPEVAHQVRTFVLEQRAKYGTSIIFTSHNMDEVTEVCDRVIFLKGGKIVSEDTPEQLASSLSTGHVRLRVKDSSQRSVLVRVADSMECPTEIDNMDVEILIDDHNIAKLLRAVTDAGVDYNSIEVGKPTLEDYFLNIAKK